MIKEKVMNDKIHPVRAGLAVATIGGTLYMLIAGMVVPDPWWVLLGSVATYYFAKD